MIFTVKVLDELLKAFHARIVLQLALENLTTGQLLVEGGTQNLLIFYVFVMEDETRGANTKYLRPDVRQQFACVWCIKVILSGDRKEVVAHFARL